MTLHKNPGFTRPCVTAMEYTWVIEQSTPDGKRRWSKPGGEWLYVHEVRVSGKRPSYFRTFQAAYGELKRAETVAGFFTLQDALM